MKLPNTGQAIIPTEKIREYLLSESHPAGRFKYVFFKSLGYTNDDWEQLKADIHHSLCNDAKMKDKTRYGQKYEIRGTLTGPNGKSADILTAWIVLNGEAFPRFITAYPGE